jgi:polyisoprenoid-binding protein YceI
MKPTFLLIATLFSFAFAASAAETYEMDSVHTTVLARVQHLGAGHSWGRFNDVKGTFTLDEADASKSSITMEVAAASIDTANAKRDEHLKGPDFLDAVQFPVISFKSSSVKKIDEKTYEAAGDFTCHGVTKPLTARINLVGKGKNPKGVELLGADTSFELNRADFGITFGPGALGESVLVMVSVEAARK